nr:MAG TPA: hypothetical protein [Caudoviricetes sp.]
MSKKVCFRADFPSNLGKSRRIRYRKKNMVCKLLVLM